MRYRGGTPSRRSDGWEMKAALYDGPDEVHLVDIELPEGRGDKIVVNGRSYRPLTHSNWNLRNAWGPEVLLYVWDDIPETTQVSISSGDPD
jgi:hypothetical protein